MILELRYWIWRTPFQNNSGSNATWNNLEGVVTDVHGDTLKLERMKVSVWDKNTLDDVLIGKGTISLRKAGANIDKDVVMSVSMKDKFGQACGTVEITLKVEESNLTGQFDGVEDEGPPVTGLFEIQEIHLTNLKNTGYLKFKFNSSYYSLVYIVIIFCISFFISRNPWKTRSLCKIITWNKLEIYK